MKVKVINESLLKESDDWAGALQPKEFVMTAYNKFDKFLKNAGAQVSVNSDGNPVIKFTTKTGQVVSCTSKLKMIPEIHLFNDADGEEVGVYSDTNFSSVEDMIEDLNDLYDDE